MPHLIRMEPGNRMLRAGFGQFAGRWFIRFDFWWFGVRFPK